MNKYCMFIFFISINFAAYSMQQQKQLKNTTNNPRSMTRQEVKSLSVMTEAYNHIPEQTTNKKAAEWVAQKAHGELLRIQKNTKPTSPTNKFIPQIQAIKHNLHTVISPNGKKEPKKLFPDNIIVLRKRLHDFVSLSSPLYDSTSPAASTLKQIEKAVVELEKEARDHALEAKKSNKENVDPNVSLKKQQSLDSFLVTTQSKQTTTSPQKRQRKRKRNDIENNSFIDNFFKVNTKKARHELPEIVPTPENKQQTCSVIIIEDDAPEMVVENTNQQNQSSPEIIIDDSPEKVLSGHEKLAAFRCKSTAACKLNFD